MRYLIPIFILLLTTAGCSNDPPASDSPQDIGVEDIEAPDADSGEADLEAPDAEPDAVEVPDVSDDVPEPEDTGDVEPDVEPDLVDVFDIPEDIVDVEPDDVEVPDAPDVEMDVAPDIPDAEPDMGRERWGRVWSFGGTTCGQTTSGRLRCWGFSTEASLPLEIQDGVQEWALMRGFAAGCAVLADRSVFCWGDAPTPGGPADDIDCGSGYCCAVERGERLTCRGELSFSFEGDWRQVSAANELVCGLRQENTRVAHDCEPNVEEPGNIYDRIGTESDPVHTVLGVGGLTGHGCTLLENSAVRCWGDFEAGQFPNSYRDLDATSQGACAITTDGDIECAASRGRAPVWLEGIPVGTFVDISVTRDTACALTVDGGILCWGDNEFGQLNVPEL